MAERPSFHRPEVAATFGDEAVVSSYQRRPDYPPETFDLLVGLIQDEPGAVLDLGCGTGFVARPLAPEVERVDAVDASAAMIAEGRRLPGGDHPHLRWVVARAEDAPLEPPYALVTAGDSLHWMDWDVVLPRLAAALSPAGFLVLLSVDGRVATQDESFAPAQLELIRRYSTLGEWRPEFDLVTSLEQRGYVRFEGHAETAAVFAQPVDEYVESFHARASLSWERMDPASLAQFDTALHRLLLDRVGSTVEQRVRATIDWGKPLRR